MMALFIVIFLSQRGWAEQTLQGLILMRGVSLGRIISCCLQDAAQTSPG